MIDRPVTGNYNNHNFPLVISQPRKNLQGNIMKPKECEENGVTETEPTIP